MKIPLISAYIERRGEKKEERREKVLLEQKKQIILQALQFIVKARTEGLLSLENDIYKMDETNLVSRFYKKSISLILDGIETEKIKEILDFEILMSSRDKKVTREDLELMYLIKNIFPAICTKDDYELEFGSRTAFRYFSKNPEIFSVRKYLEELEKEEKRNKLKELGQIDYPIKSDPKYKEAKEYLDSKMSILLETDDKKIQIILREVSSEDLTRVLGLCDESIKNKVLGNCSGRLQDMIIEDIEFTFYWPLFGKEEEPITIEEIIVSVDRIIEIIDSLREMKET